MLIDSTGKVGINTTSPLSTLDLRANTVTGGTISVASASGKTSFAALVANNDGVGDLFTASSSGTNKFTVKRTGELLAPAYATCTLKTDTNGLFTCGVDNNSGGAGSSPFAEIAGGVIVPNNSTVDFLVGGQATTAAKFAITGVAAGTPVATLSASTNNNGLVLSASDSRIQSLRNNGLTLGGDTTGNISISPLNGGAGSLLTINAITTTLNGTTTLTGTSLIAITGGATAIDFTEFDVAAATGSITIDDTGNAGQISIEGSILDIDSLTFVGAGLLSSGGANALTLDTGGAAAINIGSTTNATSVSLCNSANCDTLTLANNADADTITIGDALDDVSITDANWSITGAGALTVASCVGCGGATTISLAANHAISSTTATEVTGLGPITLTAGTYVFQYFIIDTTATGTVSPMYAVNFTGTAAVRKMTLRYTSTGTTAITGLADDVGATTGQIMEAVTVTAFATTAPNMGHTGGQTVTNNVFKVIEGIMIVTASGDLELWHGSETATATTTVAGTSVMVKKIGAGSDLAEIYSTTDTTIGAGDVVSLDSSLNAGVKKSDKPYDKNAFGIISTSPSLVMGTLDDPGVTPVLVAFSGRVPVKVTSENGPIKFGDLLTSSSTPGVAMRATKAGQIIGQAMTEFDGGGVGKVMAFIKTDYSNGAKLADIFPGLSQARTEPVGNIGKLALAQFISQKEQLAAPVNLSEITTDRLMAGLEVITPKVITEELTVDKIRSSTGNDVVLNLTSEGQFVIRDENEQTVITFDSEGNAFFAGVVTADKIKANQIEGLSIMANEIIAGVISDQLANLITPVMFPSAKASDSAILEVSESSSAASLDIATVKNLEASGVLVVDKPAEFRGPALFAALVDFVQNVIFRGDVEFVGRPTFNKDTGGYAAIKEGEKQVRISFEKEYSETPIVTANSIWDISEENLSALTHREIYLLQKQDFVIAAVTSKGFTILLEEPAVVDLKFSWTALAVKDAKTSTSEVKSQNTSEVLPTPSSTPVPEITPEVTSSAQTN